MTHTASHIIISKVSAFAKANKYSIAACVAAFVAGAVIF